MKYKVKVSFYTQLPITKPHLYNTFEQIGIIGGSGLDDPDIFKDASEQKVVTPYGDPSDSLICGKLNGIDCVLLARLYFF